ncbi:enhanced serine sensitivity protein SseB C-terminal domain-containing protein [Streptomyces sp. V4-01]|uniref:Enhanced serine sensitivity protein SseB C-terminal domain-containing protein n=1 Tax=Actinacidiphila polyblastidii TaxID=3110430 RepID=A0ABU7P4M0_9ACTN|nr:enhanced serine sensitivity protein SseB C-terminal domain-containing protein [Streptomyces sp. V4-01]
MIAGAQGGAAAAGQVERMLHQVAPGRFDAYENLLVSLAEGQVWMLLWHGRSGAPDAQYGSMQIGGHPYAPCVSSPRELAASGWTRDHEVVSGRDIALTLYPDRCGLWLNPHAAGGGVGIPWADLRRIAVGLDVLPAGPLQIAEPSLQLPQFYALLAQAAHATPAVRALRNAWVQPALGEPYLAIGVEVYDGAPQAVEAVRLMMQQAVAGVPDGLAVSTVALGDPYDPVALWMRANAPAFFDRQAHAGSSAWGPR